MILNSGARKSDFGYPIHHYFDLIYTKAYRIRNSKLHTDNRLKEINQKRREQQDAICDFVFCFCVILLCLLIIVYVSILYRFMKNKYNNGGSSHL